jgi:hypothetical protein
MLCGGLFAVALLLGIVVFIIGLATTTCLCLDLGDANHSGGPACTGTAPNYTNKDKCCAREGGEEGCMTVGTKTLLWIAGSAFISAAWIFLCGVCACCCFAPEDGAAGAAAPAAAAPVAAPVAAPAAAAPAQ